MSDSKKLNPAVRSMEYGNRELTTIQLYPLSYKDQKEMTSVAVAAVLELASGRVASGNNVAFAQFILDQIETHLVFFIKAMAGISDEEAHEVASRLTNDQAMQLIQHCWEMNYEGPLKNGQDLFNRMKKVFPMKRSSQPSSAATPNTALNTSTESPSEKVD